jgi:xylulokinase
LRNWTAAPSALAVSSLGEAMVPVTRQREILASSILCMDSRGAEYIDRLRESFDDRAFYSINPNTLGPQYSLPKLLWLRDHEPAVFDKADFFLLWADLVPFMLGCEPIASNSLANRTLLFDLSCNDWSEPLLRWSGIDRSRLGRVVPGGTVLGTISREAAAELGLPADVTLVAGGHDQCCNALGSGVIAPGQAVCGIGSFECLTPTYSRIEDPLQVFELGLNIEHHVLADLYVSFVFNQAGTLVKWFRDTFAAADRPPEGMDVYQMLNEEMPDEPTRLLVLPHFEPAFCPRLIFDAGGVIMGLGTHTTRGEILKAIMEGVTVYFVESIQSLNRLGADTTQFVATGGGARSDRWLQIKADIFGVPFIRPRVTEGSLVGAAMLAGLSTGVFANPAEAVSRFVEHDRVFEPCPTRHRIYQERLALYHEMLPSTHALLRRL